MKFEEVYALRTEGTLSSEEAAMMLGMSSRTLRRYERRYEAYGLDGLFDKRLSRRAHNAASEEEVMVLAELYRSRYEGYNISHFYDCYRDEHRGVRSYNWVRKSLQDIGCVSVRKKRGPHRRRRPRRALKGMLLHQDGSSHEWVEGRIWDLIVTMDDADNEIYSAFFVEEEGTWSSMRGVRDVIEVHGLFCSLYTDRGSHYWVTTSAGKKVDKERQTQFKRGMDLLGIEMIAAYSPEARGRSERMFGTLQGRLPQALKSAGISEMADANLFLKEVFLPKFNKRFRVKTQEDMDAFVPWTAGHMNLEDILCLQTERTVCKDNTVRYRGKVWQINRDGARYSYAKAKVKVHEYMDGAIGIFYGPRRIAHFDAEEVVAVLSKEACGLVDEPEGTASTLEDVWKRPWTSQGLPTAFPHSLASRPQGPQAQQLVEAVS